MSSEFGVERKAWIKIKCIRISYFLSRYYTLPPSLSGSFSPEKKYNNRDVGPIIRTYQKYKTHCPKIIEKKKINQ